jgi:hypothetical protein
MTCKPLTKKEWESSVADAFSLAVKSTYQDLIDEAVKAEREACAKVCEDGINNATDWDSSAWDQACENRAWAIRARGQA